MATAIGVIVCLGLTGCNRSRSEATPSAKPAASASAPAKPEAPVASSRLRPTEYCRAIKVSGQVTPDGAGPLTRGAELEGDRWLTLKEGASVVVRHAQSSREYALTGPGRARPCHSGQEEVLLASGELKATTGGGVRPGAFVTIATPWGTLRYGNADLTIRAASQAAEVRVNAGTVWVEPSQGATRTGEAKLTGPKAKGRLEATAEHSPEMLFRNCERNAKAAEDKAEALVHAPNRPGIGAEAAQHVRLRSAARNSCQIAEAALGLAIEPALATALAKRLDAANQQWQRVPSKMRQQK